MKLKLHPLTLRAARAYVNEYHRHHKAPQGGLFAIGAQIDGKLVGCVIVGRPVARMRNDGFTVEATRLTTDETKNTCSFLYGAARRAALALGYNRILTYTLESEPGTSLRAAGWKLIGKTEGRSWSRPKRGRTDKHPVGVKLIWQG